MCMSTPEREAADPPKQKEWPPSSKHEIFQKLAFVFDFAFSWAYELLVLHLDIHLLHFSTTFSRSVS